jgi:uncharacterized membrane protein
LVKLTTRKIVVSGILGAIAILMGYIPFLGFIPAPTPAGNMTIMHIPAILGGILEGPVVGLLIGLIFGIISFLKADNPLFADPLVAILPRLFIGVFAYFAYAATRRINRTLAAALGGAVGSATNTVLVLGMIVLRGYLPLAGALFIAVSHGIIELIIGTVITVILVLGLQRIRGFEEADGRARRAQS